MTSAALRAPLLGSGVDGNGWLTTATGIVPIVLLAVLGVTVRYTQTRCAVRRTGPPFTGWSPRRVRCQRAYSTARDSRITVTLI
jgi:hypothetical protein